MFQMRVVPALICLGLGFAVNSCAWKLFKRTKNVFNRIFICLLWLGVSASLLFFGFVSLTMD